uniref:Uncharacterized protein n=1 Tax=Prymnesium polylepis TaxID=72548 RepID=A0A7S4JCS1_9EUKA
MPKFGSVPELQIVEMHKNRVAAIPDDFFNSMPALSRLVLSGNQISALPASICACTQLKQLQIQENKLTALPPGAWPKSLETIFLQDNPLSELPSELSGCSALVRVNVSKLPLSEGSQGVAAAMGKIALGKKGGVYWDPSGNQANS